MKYHCNGRTILQIWKNRLFERKVRGMKKLHLQNPSKALILEKVRLAVGLLPRDRLLFAPFSSKKACEKVSRLNSFSQSTTR